MTKVYEITYDTIIKYLTTDLQTNIFNTPKNGFTSILSFPFTFENILSNNFYRYGITIKDNNNNNISFWSSLLIYYPEIININNIELVDQNTTNLNKFKNENLLIIIGQLKNTLIQQFSKKKLSFCLKKYNKSDLNTHIESEIDNVILQYIVEILDINIIIFDFQNENIYGIYKNDYIDFNKNTIFLALYEYFWEPILLNKNNSFQKIFTINDPIIKKIINEKYTIKYFGEADLNKEFKYLENNIIHLSTNVISQNNLNKTKLNRMKLEELLHLSKELNLDIDNLSSKESTKKNRNKITKAYLIGIILQINN